MNFMFSWQEQYLTRSLRSLVRYSLTREILFLPREHKIHIFEPTCNVLLVYSEDDLVYSEDDRDATQGSLSENGGRPLIKNCPATLQGCGRR